MTRRWAVVLFTVAVFAGACSTRPATTPPDAEPAASVDESAPPVDGVSTTGQDPSSLENDPGSTSQGSTEPGSTSPGSTSPGSTTLASTIDPAAESPASDHSPEVGTAPDEAGINDDEPGDAAAEPIEPLEPAGSDAPQEPDEGSPEIEDIEDLLAQVDDLLGQADTDLAGLDRDLADVVEGLNQDEGDI